MYDIGRLLVVLSDAPEPSLALQRAQLIATATGAHLHLLLCDRQHDRSALLAGLKAQLADAGHSVSGEQAWDHSLHETIIEVQQAEGCDLVIKQHLPEPGLKLLAPEDWQLLRHCPCAVLMVKHARPWRGGNILAAVDVGNPDDAHRSLQTLIIDQAFQIAELAHGQLHLVSAHPGAGAAPPLARYAALQEHFDFRDEALHVGEGAADVLIAQVAADLHAPVTVIGTVARSGIAGALIGNTAETVLDALGSDVLVLKTDEMSAHLISLLRRE